MLEVIDYNEYAEKIRAYQSPPEYADSNFWMYYSEKNNGTIYDGLTIVDIQRHRTTRVKYTELFEAVMTYAEEAAEAAEDFKLRDGVYYSPYSRNYTEYIMYTFNLKKRPSTKVIHRLKALFTTLAEEYSAYREYYQADEIAEIMTLLSGEKYACTNLIGYSQGDTVKCIYKESEWTKAALEVLETEYWNGGSEYAVTDEDNDPDFTVHMYFTQWNNEEIRKEIAAEYGTTPENVTMESYY